MSTNTRSNADARMEEIRALARDYAEDAVLTLAEIQSDPDAAPAARVVAANSLLNRGFGMPERRVEQKVDVTIYDQRTAHLQALKQLAEDNPVVEIVEDAEYTMLPAPKAQTKENTDDKKQPVQPQARPEKDADADDWG